eukprot:1131077-Amphidinium_carterae.1
MCGSNVSLLSLAAVIIGHCKRVQGFLQHERPNFPQISHILKRVVHSLGASSACMARQKERVQTAIEARMRKSYGEMPRV